MSSSTFLLVFAAFLYWCLNLAPAFLEELRDVAKVARSAFPAKMSPGQADAVKRFNHLLIGVLVFVMILSGAAAGFISMSATGSLARLPDLSIVQTLLASAAAISGAIYLIVNIAGHWFPTPLKVGRALIAHGTLTASCALGFVAPFALFAPDGFSRFAIQ